jgi:LysR family transcriptional regulator, glycine cleavage system transcriptional activator
MASNGHTPPLSALRAFEAAARHMSFSKAADELAVTPAAISHQIHALEQDLGVQLFHRRNRQVALTASARVLLPGLSEAFAEIQASVRRLRSHNDTGTLTVTASPSFAAKWLVLRLHRFQQRCLDIDVRISASDELVDLGRGDFDIAVRYGTGRYPGLVVEQLLQNEVFPACSPRLLAGGPPLRTPDDLRHHALIHDQAIERDPLVPTWAMWLKAAGVKEIPASPGLSFNNSSLALDAAIAGRGVVLAYSTIAAADIAAGRLIRLFSLSLPDLFAYYVVTAPGALDRPKVKAFRDWLRCEADGGEEPAALRPEKTLPRGGGGLGATDNRLLDRALQPETADITSGDTTNGANRVRPRRNDGTGRSTSSAKPPAPARSSPRPS